MDKKSTITVDQVEHTAHLARLNLNDAEKKMFCEQLSKIISHINKLNEVDTEGVEPTSHVLPMTNVFREDEVKGSIEIDEFISHAPDVQDRFFRVPKVFEGE